MYGYKPFDTSLTAVDNLVLAVFTMGEAWHNYHHTFPQVSGTASQITETFTRLEEERKLIPGKKQDSKNFFTQDYRVSEYMWKANITSVFIDFCAWNGWVWDRKRMSKEVSTSIHSLSNQAIHHAKRE